MAPESGVTVGPREGRGRTVPGTSSTPGTTTRGGVGRGTRVRDDIRERRPERRDGPGIAGESDGQRPPGAITSYGGGDGGRVSGGHRDRPRHRDGYHRHDHERRRYRTTSYSNYYRYCRPYYWGDPYYYYDPWSYHYTSIDLHFGFRGYYPYDRYYGYYGAPTYVVIEDPDPWRDKVGVLDLNVRPKDTEVYLNGYPIGTVGDFDGVPQLLWLEEGEYELIFYNEGYRTERRIYEVLPGLEINVGLRMEPGEAVLPEVLSHRTVDPATFSPADDEAELLAREAVGEDGAVSVDVRGLDTREVPARVRLTVEPEDASVYLDGRFVGTGEQIADHLGALLVSAGEHVLEVVHPGYEARELTFRVDEGEELALAVPSPGPSHGSAGR